MYIKLDILKWTYTEIPLYVKFVNTCKGSYIHIFTYQSICWHKNQFHIQSRTVGCSTSQVHGDNASHRPYFQVHGESKLAPWTVNCTVRHTVFHCTHSCQWMQSQFHEFRKTGPPKNKNTLLIWLSKFWHWSVKNISTILLTAPKAKWTSTYDWMLTSQTTFHKWNHEEGTYNWRKLFYLSETVIHTKPKKKQNKASHQCRVKLTHKSGNVTQISTLSVPQ